MRLTRLVAGVVAAGLTLTGPVLLSSPAHAADVATTVTVNPPARTELAWGDKLSLSGKIAQADGKYTNSGSTASLQISTPANPAWTTVDTATATSSFYFSNIAVPSNAQFKVVFSGGTSGFGASANTVLASESAPVAVTVARTLSIKTKKLKVLGKVTPKYAKGKVQILQLVGKKAKKYKTVKTDKKARFVFNAPRKNKFKFIVVIPGSAEYAGTYEPYEVSISRFYF
jgi:uncharacterized cupredoxin-like copper-binding protein